MSDTVTRSYITASGELREYEYPRPEAGGQLDLQEVKAQHFRAAQLSLQGLTNIEIGSLLGKSPAWVANTLAQDEIREYIATVLAGAEQSLNNLHFLAVERIRDGLKSGNPDVSLRAVDLLFKATNRYRPREDERTSAEDVIKRVLDLAQESLKIAGGREDRARLSRNRMIDLRASEETTNTTE